MTVLMFVCAIALSAVAAFYSIVGLVAIFAASPIPIIIMGSMLEVSKLVVASWIYRYWKQVPILLKTYFTVALLILMLLTSMGIYGFLSKAHIEHGAQSSDSQLLIDELDRQIEIEKANITDAKNVIGQLDKAVNVLANAERIRGPDGALAVRQSQQKERTEYNKIITNSNAKIVELEKQKSPLLKQQLDLETEVGPIKYIAALVYDDVDKSILEKAIRAVIILIVVVFDPLAVLLLIAANWTVLYHREPKKVVVNDIIEEDEMNNRERDPVTKEDILAGPTSTEQPVEVEPQPNQQQPVANTDDDLWRSRPNHIK